MSKRNAALASFRVANAIVDALAGYTAEGNEIPAATLAVVLTTISDLMDTGDIEPAVSDEQSSPPSR